MAPPKVRHSATQSTRGTVFQLCVALRECYRLQPTEKLLIEELGDVTVEGSRQIEVKQESGVLSDGHRSFWKTLRNWMDEAFSHEGYQALVLHTTQVFGAKARLATWNDLDGTSRLDLLRSIHKDFEEAYKARSTGSSAPPPSSVLKYQRFVLDQRREPKLRELIGKVLIEAGADGLSDLYGRLKQDRARSVLSGKRDDFMNALIGFVCRPGMAEGDRWEISCESFNEKIQELTATYSRETREFPRKQYLEHEAKSGDAVRDDLFVEKIREIEYASAVARAIHHYEAAIRTMSEEFAAYRVDPSRFRVYSDEVEGRFETSYRRACRECRSVIGDSQAFYDRTVSAPGPAFPGFGDSPDWFRNGLLHIRMNESGREFRWKLSKQ